MENAAWEDARWQSATERNAGTLSRRRLFLGVTGGCALAVLDAAVRPGTGEAATAGLPVVRDTFQGLLAFVVPGQDAYSRRQGRTSGTVGGVDAGAAPALEYTYDQAVPFPVVGRPFDLNLPGAAAVAALLNITALDVDPASAAGPFTAPFARLSYAQKAEVFRRLERPGLADGTPVRFIIATLPTLTAFAVYSEAPVFDRRTGRLRGTPAGWKLSNYSGVFDGWDEFKGYYRGIDHVPATKDRPGTTAP